MSLKTDIKVLFLDDVASVRKTVRSLLESMGFTQIDDAANGTSGWEKLTSALRDNQPYDLVISDFLMPELTGAELAEKIRAHQDARLNGVKFLMITGSDDKVRKAIDAGANSYISKPFDEEELAKRLDLIFR